MRYRVALVLAGLLLTGAGAVLTTGWYAPLPAPAEVGEPDVSGATVFRACLLLEGFLLVVLGLAGWRWVRLGVEQRAHVGEARPPEGGTRPMGWRTSVVLLTLLALGLRLFRADLDLWLDEIVTVVVYAKASITQIWVSYTGSNNHLLNSVLVKASTLLWGETETAVRLPAILFGAASIPALYWMPGRAVPRRVRLAAAALLAVSYHHVFFSQNARGYSPYLFFSIATTGLFLRALDRDRLRDWLLWVLCTVLAFASLLLSTFVFAAQALVGALAILRMHQGGRPAGPLTRRLVIVFAGAGLLAFHLYSVVVPQFLNYIEHVYKDPAVGAPALSAGFLSQLAQGLAAGVGLPWVLAAGVLGMAVGIVGLVVMWRRSWALAVLLTLPLAIQLGTLLVRGLSAQPRMFLLALPLGLPIAMLGLDAIGRALGKRMRLAERTTQRAFLGLVAIACLASAWTLRGYYAVPKQPYRAALQYVVDTRQPAEVTLVASLASTGVRYYGPQAGLEEGRDFIVVASEEELAAAAAAAPGRSALLVTTLFGILEKSDPAMAARIASDWELLAEYRGTLGGGAIGIWRRRARGR